METNVEFLRMLANARHSTRLRAIAGAYEEMENTITDLQDTINELYEALDEK